VDEYASQLNVSRLDELTDQERDANLSWMWRNRGPLYGMSANSLMTDYGDPAFIKLHYRCVNFADNGGGEIGSNSVVDRTVWGCQNLPSYIMLGWETGILNECSSLRRNGLTKEQIMELVMFTQLYAGMRGLGHVYRAIGDFLPAWGPPPGPLATFPEGWAADPEAFKSGLDLSTREMTPTDRRNLEGWYERNIGYVPASIAFGLKYHPEFVKVNRAKWEVAIRTLPKQVAPYIMFRMNGVSQNVEGLREATLLCKAWGVKRKFILQSLAGVIVYFTSLEGFYAPAAAIDDILETME
jgi:hypothetical protein